MPEPSSTSVYTPRSADPHLAAVIERAERFRDAHRNDAPTARLSGWKLAQRNQGSAWRRYRRALEDNAADGLPWNAGPAIAARDRWLAAERDAFSSDPFPGFWRRRP